MMARSTEVMAGLSDRLKVRRIINELGRKTSIFHEVYLGESTPPAKPSFGIECTLPQAGGEL
jgi:hypothetical protein